MRSWRARGLGNTVAFNPRQSVIRASCQAPGNGTGHSRRGGRVCKSGRQGPQAGRRSVQGAVPPRPPPRGGRARGPAGVKRLRGGRGAPPPLAAPGARRPAARALGVGRDWRRAAWRECDKCRLGRPPRGGRAHLSLPVCAARRRSAARTAAPRARAQSARREHDFCLQAGFPPGHDGRGPPASSRQNVSVAARPPPGRWSGAPRRERAGGGAPAPWGRGGRLRFGRALGFGAGAGCGERWERVRRSGGARGGAESGDQRAGRRVPGSGRGVRPAGIGERGAASQGGVGACTLVSFEIRGCWSSRGPFTDLFLPNCPLLLFYPLQKSFSWGGGGGRKKRGGGDNYKTLK